MASSTLADPALDALFLPFDSGDLPAPTASVLFLRARVGAALQRHARPGWRCLQSFRPDADALAAADMSVGRALDDVAPADERFDTVLLLPPRQRDEARAMLATAFDRLAPGGRMVAAAPNDAGAGALGSDMERLAGPLQRWSKHRCRVFASSPQATIDATLQAEWRALDAVRPIDRGFVSRPGLFAWDRLDPGSALLAELLPEDLAGAAADLGAGHGLLACELLRRCAGIRSIALFEAEARALQPAAANLEAVNGARAQPARVTLHWHDVSHGVPGRYEVIVSNPPFHVGREDRPDLGRAFIEAAADALADSGSLWLVANRHLPYEATLATRFASVREVAVRDGYKVFHATMPRPTGGSR